MLKPKQHLDQVKHYGLGLTLQKSQVPEIVRQDMFT